MGGRTADRGKVQRERCEEQMDNGKVCSLGVFSRQGRRGFDRNGLKKKKQPVCKRGL
jgi:hypothetical protein